MSGMKETSLYWKVYICIYNSIYFPCDGRIEEALFDDDDMEIIN